MSGVVRVPPFNAAPLHKDGDQFSHAWVAHLEDQARDLAELGPSVITTVTTGVVDGSDAAAGKIGEFIEATIGVPVALIGAGTTVNVGSISLTAGDWDAWGSVVYDSSAANLLAINACLSTVSGTFQDPGSAALNTNAGTTRFSAGTRLTVGPRRLNLTVTTTIYLAAASAFPAGTSTARGYLAARRMR